MTYKIGEDEQSLWSDDDGLYYDVIQFSPRNSMQLPLRSLVGLIPLYATPATKPATIKHVPGFKKLMEWFIDDRPEVSARNMVNMRGKDSCFIRQCHRFTPAGIASPVARSHSESNRCRLTADVAALSASKFVDLTHIVFRGPVSGTYSPAFTHTVIE